MQVGSTYIPPSLWLRRKRERLFPTKPQDRCQEFESPLHSAAQVIRWFSKPHPNVAPAFLVTIHVSKHTMDTTWDPDLNGLLNEFDDVFSEPTVNEWQKGLLRAFESTRKFKHQTGLHSDSQSPNAVNSKNSSRNL
jgi:hypothetical protein